MVAMTRSEKCEAILKKMLEMINKSGKRVTLEYDFGDHTATIYDDRAHTHVGVPGNPTEDTWNIFVENLYNSLHGGPGLSWYDPDAEPPHSSNG